MGRAVPVSHQHRPPTPTRRSDPAAPHRIPGFEEGVAGGGGGGAAAGQEKQQAGVRYVCEGEPGKRRGEGGKREQGPANAARS